MENNRNSDPTSFGNTNDYEKCDLEGKRMNEREIEKCTASDDVKRNVGERSEDEEEEKVTHEDDEGRESDKHQSGAEHMCRYTQDASAPVNDCKLLGDVSCPQPPPRQRKKSKGENDRSEGKETLKEKPDERESVGRTVEANMEMHEEKTEERPHCNRNRDSRDDKNQNKKEKGEISGKTMITKNSTDETNISATRMRYMGEEEDKHDAVSGKKFERENKTILKRKGKKAKKEVEEEDTGVGLKKELSLINCIGIMMGNIIGTGIFVSPRAVLQYTGSVGLSLIVWTVTGIVTIIGALCYAELGTMIPQSGGNYTYLHEAFGPLPAFIYVWMIVVISIPGGRAIAALTFSNYVLQPFFVDTDTPPQSALRIVGILLILLLTFINIKKVKWATSVQDALALTKVLALIMIIIVGIFHLNRGTTSNYDNPMEGTTTDAALIATAFYHTMYAYDGWDGLNNIMEEIKDPFRNMPRGIAISICSVMVIYILTNIAYFAVLPKDLMLSSSAVAVTFGNIALGTMAWTIPIFVACSTGGGLNGSIFAASRLLFVSARRGHFPRVLSLVHVENNTPITSLVFLAAMSMVMFVTSDVRILINYLAFSTNLLNLACIGSFFWFRIKYPDLPRPIKVWIGFPIIFTIVSIFLTILPVIKRPIEVVAALVVIGTGLPVYYFFIHREKKQQSIVTAMDKVTYVCQLLFMAVPEENSNSTAGEKQLSGQT